MTPRDAEVAFLLEGVPGVVAVHAVRGRPPMRWAVRYEGTRGLAAAHYALRRALSYEECASVATPPATRSILIVGASENLARLARDAFGPATELVRRERPDEGLSPTQPRTIGRPLSRIAVEALLDRIDFLDLRERRGQ